MFRGGSVFALLFLVACEGPVGPQGPQGEQGIPGPQGEQGIPGIANVVVIDTAINPPDYQHIIDTIYDADRRPVSRKHRWIASYPLPELATLKGAGVVAFYRISKTLYPSRVYPWEPIPNDISYIKEQYQDGFLLDKGARIFCFFYDETGYDPRINVVIYLHVSANKPVRQSMPYFWYDLRFVIVSAGG